MNLTSSYNVTEFVLLGFTQNPHLQRILLTVILFIFLFTILTSLLITLTISLSPTLLALMYFFLTHLSFLDASFTSVTTPKMVIDPLYQKRTIFWGGCLTQLFVEHPQEDHRLLSSLSWPMTAMQPSGSLYTSRPSCDRGSASSWWWWPVSTGSYKPLCRFFS